MSNVKMTSDSINVKNESRNKESDIDPPDKLLDSTEYDITKTNYISNHQTDKENSTICYDFQNSKLVLQDSSNQAEIQMANLTETNQHRRQSYENDCFFETKFNNETAINKFKIDEENNSKKFKDSFNKYTERDSTCKEYISGYHPYAESNFKVISFFC